MHVAHVAVIIVHDSDGPTVLTVIGPYMELLFAQDAGKEYTERHNANTAQRGVAHCHISTLQGEDPIPRFVNDAPPELWL